MTGGKLRIALLAGGRSAEREISLKSGDQVYAALDKSRYEVLRYDPMFDLTRLASESKSIDAALIILHGRMGEDGTIQGFLDSLEIPYQGSGVLGSSVAMNKILSKQLYVQAGLPVALYEIAVKGETVDFSGMVGRLGLPLVVKPEHEGSSIGLSVVKEESKLPEAVELAWSYDRRCMVERFIAGVEVTGGVLGNDTPQALPLIEIIPGEGYEFFDYAAKYTPGASREICPARISPELTEKVQELAVRAHKALFCRGYSRTDTIVAGNDIFLLETNTIPGMTATSLFPQAAAAAGLSFPALLDRLIGLALENRPRKGNPQSPSL